MLTLFDDDLRVDVAATAAHAARLVELGVQAVVVAGSTGEAGALTAGERVSIVRAVREAVPADVPVLAGTGAAWSGPAIEMTRAVADAGADGVLVLSPTGVADSRAFYDAVVSASSVPVLAYHYPNMSPPGIPLDVLADLPVAGVKDSSGDLDRLRAQVQVGRAVYVGAAGLVHTAAGAGCPGVILAVANVEPELCVRTWAGDTEAARELAAADSRAKGPVALKASAAERFGLSAVSRVGR